ncbi:hypothetical protein MPTK1_1g19350 [Marchantia polymorpha subsp. ruderalis]|uniref:RRM domain-containing protein n=2 Tax=Marchantia polymorpha TaxID=3197 RepID=A0AAF6ARV5_MARPO|nr:hypothetical protein MARPO_0001s0273 [Marchantia polymorpha]BBM99175.1 hypothetical protein Mp_1g19350 [Marchantia polymorpha subsp. ruderalis]|eukprot:PTQ50253.1 hypothetical protein MARPO_0001s0273 [Marchantia polymorpha]
MGDYGGAWRGADTRRVPSPAAKRTRRDYGDYDDVPPARGAYGSARGGAGVVPAVGHDVGGYTPRGERYDDGRGAPRGGWREPDALGGTTDLMGYGGGAIGNDLAITGGPGMGLSGVPGAGSLQNLGLGGLGEDPALLGPGGRMVGIDVGLGGRQGNLGLNGVTQEPEVLHGGLDMLPPDASSTLFVDGLPLDCSRREAAHIFRPFIGFKEVRLVHKDAKRVVLCFVEFADARCAATALEALQGYKFDETDPDSYALRLSFARHPGPRGPPPRDEAYRGGGGRGTRDSYDAGDRRRGARR